MGRTCKLAADNVVCSFVVESSVYPGVKRITDKVAKDVKKVCGVLPEVITNDIFPKEDMSKEDSVNFLDGFFEGHNVFVGTLGNSETLDYLCDLGLMGISQIQGKREVYKIAIVENSLIIAGSDKLGTIYGLFALSEYIGVSPLIQFGDVVPQHRDAIILEEDIEVVSKEPSVKYRGFFINDEWPCFGTWAMKHFGGVNAKLYDHVFEFLLRMKGNFMWPAMWASSFPLDGPGSLNEELADMYGITIAYSHHEPCLRASEEWDQVKGPDSPYGTEWNFHTNMEGLVNYWTDSLKRSGKYKHLVTIGMRGERDSSMLGPDATLKENIDLLKTIIRAQRGLIMHYVNYDVDKVPQLLALYKEVEAYYYGDENTEGLKEWKDLENVIIMFCEDNFGHMRTLPTKEMRSHKGGYGMYYHFDYHGGPVSYEWMPSTPLSLVWEQMTEAYDYGIKDVWIVNVGDIKGNEVALNYFLDLAYDFDKWGSSAPNSWQTYLTKWAARNFPSVSKELQQALADIYVDFVNLNFMRRPESLHAGIYHPCNYSETDRMLARIQELEERNEKTYEELDRLAKIPAYSMIYYPARISMNLIKMQLFAGKNQYYAGQGRPYANLFGDLIKECIEEDKRLCTEFSEFRNSKWAGMELEKHIGFTKWNDDGWRYPVRSMVEPVSAPRMSVSREDDPTLATKNYGAPQCIKVYDFLNTGRDEVSLEISNDGVDVLHFTVKAEKGNIPEWLKVSALEGDVESLTKLVLTCDRVALVTGVGFDKEASTRLLISDGDATVAVEVKAKATNVSKLEEMTFLPTDGMIVMNAEHFRSKKGTERAEFVLLQGHGRSGNGVKALPSTEDFLPEEDKPEITYQFVLEQAGNYVVELWTSPVNSVVSKRALRAVVGNDGEEKIINILDEDFRGGDYNDYRWSSAVMNQIHVVKTEMSFKKGVQHLTIGALEAGMVLERILIYPAGKNLKPSYLGPQESYFKN